MNKYINNIILISFITLTGMIGMTSCTDYLDMVKKNIGNRKNFVFLPVILIMVIFGDGLPATILIQRHVLPVLWEEILMGTCGTTVGMAYVKQILVSQIWTS